MSRGGIFRGMSFHLSQCLVDPAVQAGDPSYGRFDSKASPWPIFESVVQILLSQHSLISVRLGALTGPPIVTDV